MKRIPGTNRMKVSADGEGVVSHAGVGMLRELAERTGLVAGLSESLLDSYKGLPVHAPGRVLSDLAVAVADGATNISGIQTLTDRQDVFGPVASMPTTWRVLDRVTEQRLPAIRTARTDARARAWDAGAGPDLGAEDAGPLVIDVDATISIAHSEKENAAATWKRSFGFHPLLAFLDRPEISGGEALAGILRPGNAGANTAADHITVIDQAVEALPEHVRPGVEGGPGVLELPMRSLTTAGISGSSSLSATSSPSPSNRWSIRSPPICGRQRSTPTAQSGRARGWLMPLTT